MWLRTVFTGHLKDELCAQSNLVKPIHLRLKLFFVQFMALLFSAQKQVTSVLMSFWLVSSINYQTNAQDKLLHIIVYGIKPHMNRSNRCMLVCLSHRLSGCAVHLAVRCVWWPAVGAGVRGVSAVWDRTLSRGHRRSRTLLQQRKHTEHRAQAHTARRHTRPVRDDGKRMKLDSGGGREI